MVNITRGTIRSFRDLEVWQKGIEIVDVVYAMTTAFPEEERFGLVAQMRRCAVSIPSNIAEGCVRQQRRAYTQFCRVALGSCAELETQLEIAGRRRYVADGSADHLRELLDHESRMLGKLIKGLMS